MLVLVAVSAATAWPADSPIRAKPGGALTGDEVWAWVYLAAAASAFLVYALGLLVIARRGVRLATVAAFAVAIQVAALAAPLVLSTDAWAYWAYGRIAASHSANPYRDTPQDFPGDPATRHVGEDWRDTTSVYGPGFTLASEPLALASGSSADVAAWIYKVLAALAVLAATALAARLAREKAFACAFVGWNPLLALHFAGGGHNDAWMAALVLGALAAGAAGRRQVAGAAWAAAIAVKWIPLLFLPLRALEARARRRAVGHLGFAVAAIALAVLATWRYGLDWATAVVGPLAANANRETAFALPHRLTQVGVPDWLATGGLALGFTAAYAWLLLEAWRGRARLGLAAGLLLLATPYLAAWYAVWTIPLAAAEEDRLAQWLALGLSAYLLRQAVPL